MEHYAQSPENKHFKCKFNMIDNVLWNRQQNILNRITTVQRIFFDHNGIQLERLKNKILWNKKPNIWNLNNILPNNLWVREQITEEIKQYVKLNNNKSFKYQNVLVTLKTTLEGNSSNKCSIKKEESLKSVT